MNFFRLSACLVFALTFLNLPHLFAQEFVEGEDQQQPETRKLDPNLDPEDSALAPRSELDELVEPYQGLGNNWDTSTNQGFDSDCRDSLDF